MEAEAGEAHKARKRPLLDLSGGKGLGGRYFAGLLEVWAGRGEGGGGVKGQDVVVKGEEEGILELVEDPELIEAVPAAGQVALALLVRLRGLAVVRRRLVQPSLVPRHVPQGYVQPMQAMVGGGRLGGRVGQRLRVPGGGCRRLRVRRGVGHLQLRLELRQI